MNVTAAARPPGDRAATVTVALPGADNSGLSRRDRVDPALPRPGRTALPAVTFTWRHEPEREARCTASPGVGRLGDRSLCAYLGDLWARFRPVPARTCPPHCLPRRGDRLDIRLI